MLLTKPTMQSSRTGQQCVWGSQSIHAFSCAWALPLAYGSSVSEVVKC